jgi:hypothetical protein
MTDVQPWERQDDETSVAFEAFAAYRDLGSARSTAKAAKVIGKSKVLCDRWSGRHAWVRRIEAWEREQDRLWRLEQAGARREVARRHARLASAAQAKVVARLQSLKAEDLSPGELMRWLDTSVRIERQAYDFDNADTRDAGPAEARSMIRDLMEGIRGQFADDDDDDGEPE